MVDQSTLQEGPSIKDTVKNEDQVGESNDTLNQSLTQDDTENFVNNLKDRIIRPWNIVFKPIQTALSSSFVTKGSTSISCGVRGALIQGIEPSVDLKLEFSAMKSITKSKDASHIKEVLERLLHQILNNDQLRVRNYESWSWILYIDITVLETDGCLLDVAWASVLAALGKLELPNVKINEDLQVHILDTSYPIHLDSFPIITSFSQINDRFLIDPTEDEEKIGSSSLVLAIGVDNRIHLLLKPKGTAITDKQLRFCAMDAYHNTLLVYDKLGQTSVANDNLMKD